MRLMGDRFLNVLKILRGGVKVVDIIWHHQKKLLADFSLSSVRLPCVFFANRGSGLRHAFFLSAIFPVTYDGLDPLQVGYVYLKTLHPWQILYQPIQPGVP